MSGERRQDTYLTRALAENWRRETEAVQMYRLAARAETDPRRRRVLERLAEVEAAHARMWEDKLRELGYDLAQLRPPAVRHVPRTTRDLVDRIEAIESGNAAWYQSLRNIVDDPDIVRILDRIDADEAEHLSASALLEATRRTHGADRRLRRIWRDERWHKQGTAEWVGDAIYGVNDGLAAIFGIISGVAGYTDNTHTVLVSGLFGALASTLSMGAGAWLATKSENELMESEMAQERREIAEDPEHELEELALLYELKGFSPDEANRIARQIGEDPERLLQTMAREELGIHETSKGNPWKSAWYGTVSTLVGGLIPLVPFFFLSGLPAMVAAAVVSIVAHFAVGAAKSLVTVRKWWASGLEMTVVGAIVGVVSYGLGLLGSALLG